MTAPNIVNVATINGKTAVQNTTTVATDIVTNSAASGKVQKINALTVSNNDSSNTSNISVDVYRSSTSYYVARNISIPPATTLLVVSKDIQLYLEEGDSLRCAASANNTLHSVCSYEEIS
jgi:hypothetical protein